MNLNAFEEMRKDFESSVGVADGVKDVFAREESVAYASHATETAFRGFLVGYLLAFEQMLKKVDRRSAFSSEPTFTVTPDARERAEAYQSVNPDYPSPATYREAE